MLFKTPLSVLPAVVAEYHLIEKLAEGMNQYQTMKGSSSFNEFAGYYLEVSKACTMKRLWSSHDFEMEFSLFTEPDKNLSVVLEKYYKAKFEMEILPGGTVEVPKELLLQVVEIVKELKTNKPFWYEVTLLECMNLFFDMEYYFKDEQEVTLPCANAIFSYVFGCYPPDILRQDFYEIRKDSKKDMMKQVSFTLQNTKNDDNGNTQKKLLLVCLISALMILFAPPNKKKFERVKKFLLINKKYLKNDDETLGLFSDLYKTLDQYGKIF